MSNISKFAGTIAVIVGLSIIPFTIPAAIIVTAWRMRKERKRKRIVVAYGGYRGQA